MSLETPLSKSDIAAAKTGHYECTELEKEIARMKECGLNCEEEELRNEHLKRFYRAIQEQYGPLINPIRKT